MRKLIVFNHMSLDGYFTDSKSDMSFAHNPIPDAEWATVQQEAEKFWEEIAATSPRCARVVQIFKDYNDLMQKAGPPYRCG